ncbi:hypothetical protein [Microbacterium imperiale]|uniref:hypothetical protein n=1 Tax=Microbacterium imperiale TaxID=33884 RepID=UPI001AE9AE69|nr:hypothetical protein [Microbacterium imperiale]MBP2420783.1 hypothetical protein [Microbacterium imperiale]MDS0200095.1 hypothetical protein [Microbacterium imperiale]BFE41124.1 hypothetical protein GCM10017544_20800 [Microbacterium imperiale]
MRTYLRATASFVAPTGMPLTGCTAAEPPSVGGDQADTAMLYAHAIVPAPDGDSFLPSRDGGATSSSPTKAGLSLLPFT